MSKLTALARAERGGFKYHQHRKGIFGGSGAKPRIDAAKRTMELTGMELPPSTASTVMDDAHDHSANLKNKKKLGAMIFGLG